MANNGQTVREELLQMRRRMVCDALGVRPKDLRDLLDLAPASISFVLRGERRLSHEELAKLRGGKGSSLHLCIDISRQLLQGGFGEEG